MRLYATITKTDAEQRMVYGYASTEALDSQGEIVRREAVEAALPDYMRYANIREMHQPSAVGIAKDAAVDEKGLYLAAKVVDDEAWRKVQAGVYKGFSIGGRVTSRDERDRKVITGCQIGEISLVDRPANPDTVFDVFKAALEPELPPATAEDRRPGAAEEAEALGKIAVMSDRLGKLAEGIGDLQRRIETLERQPAPARAVLRAIGKAEDRDGAGRELDDAALLDRLAKLSGEDRAALLIKLAQMTPLRSLG